MLHNLCKKKKKKLVEIYFMISNFPNNTILFVTLWISLENLLLYETIAPSQLWKIPNGKESKDMNQVRKKKGRKNRFCIKRNIRVIHKTLSNYCITESTPFQQISLKPWYSLYQRFTQLSVAYLQTYVARVKFVLLFKKDLPLKIH